MPNDSRHATLPAYGYVESTIFTARVYDYFTDDEYAEFQFSLAQNPLAGDVVQGTGGLRKIRYFLIDEDAVIYLLTIFDKDEMVDLTAQEKKALKKLVDVEKAARRARRQRGTAQ